MTECRIGWSAVAWFLLFSAATLAAERDTATTSPDESSLPAEWRDHALLVKSPDVRLRESPDAQSAVVIEFSLAGIWLHARQLQGDWLKVENGWLKYADVVIDDAALEYFTNDIRVTQRAFAYVSRARAWMLKSEFDKAQTDLSEALRLEPECARACCFLGRLAYDQDRYDDSLANCDRALQLDPREVFALHLRGWLFLERREFDRAIREFDAALTISPRNASVWVQGRRGTEATESRLADAAGQTCKTRKGDR